jgi:hypothetical protein
MEKFTIQFLDDLKPYDPLAQKKIGTFNNEQDVASGAYIDEKSRKHLIIEAEDIDMGQLTLEGVVITSKEIDNPKLGTRSYIDFCPTHKDFIDNLLHLCNDILELVSSGENTQEATQYVLKKWGLFLAKPKVSRLSEQQIIGLFGELLVLEWLIINDKSPAKVLEGWKGPKREPRDFEYDAWWIESKATRRKDKVVEIHGINQLESPNNGVLYLWLSQLNVDSAKGDSLCHIVNRLESLFMSVVDLVDFRNKLSEAGFDLRDSAYYNEFLYSKDETTLYKVNDTFPKIISSSLIVPEKVVSLSYNIELLGLDTVEPLIALSDDI